MKFSYVPVNWTNLSRCKDKVIQMAKNDEVIRRMLDSQPAGIVNRTVSDTGYTYITTTNNGEVVHNPARFDWDTGVLNFQANRLYKISFMVPVVRQVNTTNLTEWDRSILVLHDYMNNVFLTGYQLILNQNQTAAASCMFLHTTDYQMALRLEIKDFNTPAVGIGAVVDMMGLQPGEIVVEDMGCIIPISLG